MSATFVSGSIMIIRAPEIKVIFGNNFSKEHEKNNKKILQSLDSKIIGVYVCVHVYRKLIPIKSSSSTKLTSLIILKITDTEKISKTPYACG